MYTDTRNNNKLSIEVKTWRSACSQLLLLLPLGFAGESGRNQLDDERLHRLQKDMSPLPNFSMAENFWLVCPSQLKRRGQTRHPTGGAISFVSSVGSTSTASHTRLLVEAYFDQ